VGLKTRLTHRVGELSGGEQQRVAIARALVMSPKLLLADEPTGNLDMTTGDGIVDLLVNLNRSEGLTMVIVTHNQRLAQRMTRQIELVDGRVHTENGDEIMSLSGKHKEWITKGLALVLCIGFVVLLPYASGAQQKKTVAVLPFTLYTPQPLETEKRNLQGMLTDRLAKHGIPVIPTNDINRHPVASLPSPDRAELISLGKNLGADLVITGTLTQIGRRISIDLKAST